MKTFFTLLISFSYLLPAAGQEPTMLSLKTYGGDGYDIVASNVTKTDDGGFVISIGSDSNTGTGSIDSFCTIGGNRSIFVKYNADASIIEWSKCYLGSGDTGFGYIFPKNDGSIVLGGQYLSSYDWGFYICKQDVLGNIVWSHGYSKGNGPLLFDMINTEDGGYIMFGEAYHVDTNTTIHYGDEFTADFWVLKLDSLGNKVWSKVIGGTDWEAAYKVVAAPGNGCYIVGYTSSDDYDCTGNHGDTSGSYDLYLARLEANGNIMWHKDLGGTGYDGGESGWPDGKGGIIIGGTTNSHDGDVTHYVGGTWVLDVDSNGNIVWNNSYGNGGAESPNAICKATDGSIWVAGVTGSKGGEIDNAYGRDDAWFIHTDSIGNLLNANVLGSDMNDKGEMIYPLSNGNVIAGGFYDDSGGTFSNAYYGGLEDVFFAIFAPQTTGINTISKTNNEVRIYPNPSNDLVTIEGRQNGKYEVMISDVMGQLIYKTRFADKTKITIDEWQRGLYYVQVINSNGDKEIQKLIVE